MPTTITKEITAYTFDELSDKAKDEVRMWWMDFDQYNWAVEGIIDAYDWPFWLELETRRVQLMNGKFREEPETAWSSYPEHLSVGYNINVAEFMKDKKLAGKLRSFYNAAVEGMVSAKVRGNPYSRDNEQDYLDFEWEYPAHIYSYPSEGNEQMAKFKAQADEVEEALKEFKYDLISELTTYFREEIEYQTSDEQLRDSSEANQYLFDEKGHLI